MEINRDKLIWALRDNCKCLLHVKNCSGCAEKHPQLCKQERQLFKAAADMLEADGAKLVPEGRWVHCEGKSNLWYCSACGEKIIYNPTRRTYNIEKRPVHEVNKYCRGCGAKMEGSDGIYKEG